MRRIRFTPHEDAVLRKLSGHVHKNGTHGSKVPFLAELWRKERRGDPALHERSAIALRQRRLKLGMRAFRGGGVRKGSAHKVYAANPDIETAQEPMPSAFPTHVTLTIKRAGALPVTITKEVRVGEADALVMALLGRSPS